MSKSTEQRVKSKIKIISKELDKPFLELMTTLFLERFLVRIQKSKYNNKFIFKGGMCLAQYIPLERETKDIDFLLTQLDTNLGSITEIIEEIMQIDVGDDLIFNKTKVSQLSLEHKKYPGYRIKIFGSLGQIKHLASVDIGIGDVVKPNTLEVELMQSNGPLFEDQVSLKAYPPEYIFSEKLEAILHLAEKNGRMKDFHDCYQLVQSNILDKKLLKQALSDTTENRGTKLSLIELELDLFEESWKEFLKKNRLQDLSMSEAVSEINTLLSSLFDNLKHF